jgi:uncharacterized protein YciI
MSINEQMEQVAAAREKHLVAQLQSGDQEQRIQAIQMMDPKRSGDVIARVAVEDKDQDVRLAAVERLDPATQGDVLAQVAVEDNDEGVRGAAKQRLAEANEAKAEDGQAPGM